MYVQLNLGEENKNKEPQREQKRYPTVYRLPPLPSCKTPVKKLKGIGFGASANLSFQQEALSAMQQ